MTLNRSGRVFSRIAAASSGDTNGVLYSSANCSAGSTVPRPPLPPMSRGGLGCCTGFGCPGASSSV